MQIPNPADVDIAVLNLKSVGQAVREILPERLPYAGHGASIRVHGMGGTWSPPTASPIP